MSTSDDAGDATAREGFARPWPLALVILTSAVLTSVACREPPTSAPERHEQGGEAGEAGEADAPSAYPGELIDPASVPRDFLARQKLSGRFGEQEFSFEAVIQKRGDTLTVIGMTPFGTKGFVLTQTGDEIAFEMLIDRELPFPPEYMLQDIHRAWLWDARLPWGAEPPASEQVEVEIAGERVVEQWTSEGLVRRTFTRLDERPAGTIRVDYVGGYRIGRPPPKVVLVNGWFGYTLELDTTDYRAL